MSKLVHAKMRDMPAKYKTAKQRFRVRFFCTKR